MTPLEGPLFVNLSHHPSSAWPGEQRSAVLAMAPRILDLDFPEADPAADEESCRRAALELADRVPPETAVAMVGGEFVTTVWLVGLLPQRGIRCLAATTRREVSIEPDGAKRSVFRFVRFREFPPFHPGRAP